FIACTVRLENPHIGNCGVPFMKSTTGWPSISAWMRSETCMSLSPATRPPPAHGPERGWGVESPYCKPPSPFQEPDMTIELPPLPYDRTALEPHISGETIDFHYGKHHKAYVDNLNKMIADTEFESMPLEEIIRKAKDGMYNNAAQVWNHTFYWNCLSPNGGGEPTGKVAEAINKAFGDFATFKEKFSDLAVKTFGSGWAWLVQRQDGSLALASTPNAV